MFGKRKPSLPDFSVIGTDLHSHLLPGLDDGAATLDEAVGMILKLQSMGFGKLIITPHVGQRTYPNTKERILGQGYAVREEVEGVEGVEMVDMVDEVDEPHSLFTNHYSLISFSGEYHLDEGFMGLLEADELIPVGKDQKYVLVEFPFGWMPERLDSILDGLDAKGLIPILAHPERYGYLALKFRMYAELRDRGFRFQMNLNSLNGLYGWPVRLTAEKLIEAGFIDVVGSDAHHMGQVDLLPKVLSNKHFIRLVESGRLINPTL